MGTCPNCGASVAMDDSFCGTCGEFLAWESDPAASRTARPVAAPPAGPASGTGPPPATPAPAAETPPSPAPAAGPPTAEDPAAEQPAVTPPTAAQPAAGRPTTATQPAATQPAAGQPTAGDRPTADRRRPADQPGAVLPGRPLAARPVIREFVEEPAAPDDVTCPNCGTANRPGRRFCRRCGTSLGPAERVEAGPRRWRWPRRPRSRLGLLDLLRLLVVALAILAVIGAAGYVAVTYGPPAIEALRDRLAKPEQIHPTKVTASSQTAAHPAGNAVDGLSNRYWTPARAGDGAGQHLEMTFDKPFRLLDILIHSGVSPQRKLFAGQARPAVLDVTIWTSNGTSTTKTLRLADRPGEQRFHHAVGSVERIRFTIKSSYGTGAGRRPALAEIELFRRP